MESVGASSLAGEPSFSNSYGILSPMASDGRDDRTANAIQSNAPPYLSDVESPKSPEGGGHSVGSSVPTSRSNDQPKRFSLTQRGVRTSVEDNRCFRPSSE